MARGRSTVIGFEGNSRRGRGAEVSKRRPGKDVLTVERPMDGLMAEERRTQIMQIVRGEGRVRVNDLAHRFGTSAVTVRNDLNELHQRVLLLRSHGGAVILDTILRERQFKSD